MQLPIIHVHLYHKNIRLKRETVGLTVYMLDVNLLIKIGPIRPLDYFQPPLHNRLILLLR